MLRLGVYTHTHTLTACSQVEEIFLEMVAKEPLLRMAVSRGLNLSLEDLDQGEEEGGQRSSPGATAPAATAQGEGDRRSERKPDTASGECPLFHLVSIYLPPSLSLSLSLPLSLSLLVAPSNTVTNTRLIGVKHTININKGSRGYGFGIASRDVTTDDKSTPIYVKNIVHEGPAFQDGRLRIGDRLLEVCHLGLYVCTFEMINPRYACARVTVVILCVYVSVCLSGATTLYCVRKYKCRLYIQCS